MTSAAAKKVSGNGIVQRLVDSRNEKARELEPRKRPYSGKGTQEGKESALAAAAIIPEEEGKSPRDQLVEKMPLELQLLLEKENDDKIYSLMGFSKVDYLKYL